MREQENLQIVLFFFIKIKLCDVYEARWINNEKKKAIAKFFSTFVFLQQEECKIYLQHCQQVILNKYLGIKHAKYVCIIACKLCFTR